MSIDEKALKIAVDLLCELKEVKPHDVEYAIEAYEVAKSSEQPNGCCGTSRGYETKQEDS